MQINIYLQNEQKTLLIQEQILHQIVIRTDGWVHQSSHRVIIVSGGHLLSWALTTKTRSNRSSQEQQNIESSFQQTDEFKLNDLMEDVFFNFCVFFRSIEDEHIYDCSICCNVVMNSLINVLCSGHPWKQCIDGLMNVFDKWRCWIDSLVFDLSSPVMHCYGNDSLMLIASVAFKQYGCIECYMIWLGWRMILVAMTMLNCLMPLMAF